MVFIYSLGNGLCLISSKSVLIFTEFMFWRLQLEVRKWYYIVLVDLHASGKWASNESQFSQRVVVINNISHFFSFRLSRATTSCYYFFFSCGELSWANQLAWQHVELFVYPPSECCQGGSPWVVWNQNRNQNRYNDKTSSSVAAGGRRLWHLVRKWFQSQDHCEPDPRLIIDWPVTKAVRLSVGWM